MQKGIPMLTVKRDLTDYNMALLICAWDAWGVPMEQRKQWVKDLGLQDEIFFNDAFNTVQQRRAVFYQGSEIMFDSVTRRS